MTNDKNKTELLVHNSNEKQQRIFDSTKLFMKMLVAWLIIMMLLLILSPLILVIFIARSSEQLVYWWLYGASRLDGADLPWTMLNPEQGQSTLIIGMLELNGELTLSECRQLLGERLVNTGAFPRVCQYITAGFVNHYWVDDPEFQIENHVLSHSSPIRSDEQMQDLIGSLFLRPFRGASPWECLVVPKLDNKNSDNLKTVLLFRLNHAIGDGSSLAYFLASSLGDVHIDLPRPTGFQNLIVKSSTVMDTLKGLWYLPSVYVSVLTRPMDHNIFHTSCKLSLTKKVSWSDAISLNKIKHVKNSLGTTVNDIFIGVLSKSVSDYCRSQGSSTSSPITIINAVSLRREIPSGFDNQIAALTLPFVTSDEPLETTDHISKMKFVLDRMKRRKAAFGLIVGFRFIAFMLPWALLKWFMFDEINKTTGNVTNLVGPREKLTIEGRRVDMLTFWQPGVCNQGLGISFCTYGDEVRMAIQTDSYALPNDEKPEIILRIFEDNFNQLCKDLILV